MEELEKYIEEVVYIKKLRVIYNIMPFNYLNRYIVFDYGIISYIKST